jgi:hypothetical protein
MSLKIKYLIGWVIKYIKYVFSFLLNEKLCICNWKMSFELLVFDIREKDLKSLLKKVYGLSLDGPIRVISWNMFLFCLHIFSSTSGHKIVLVIFFLHFHKLWKKKLHPNKNLNCLVL